MTEIRFYHMEQSTLDQALPAITAKATQSGKPVLIKTTDQKDVKRLSDLLWSYKADSFLAHGTEAEPRADDQPVLITCSDDNMNDAKIVIMTNGCTYDSLGQVDLCCEMLDGRVESHIADARKRWKEYKSKGYTLTYWQQNDKGAWHKK